MNTYTIHGIRIVTTRSDMDWIATEEDYDGAPDSGDALGWDRDSELQAVNDLLFFLDLPEITQLEAAA